MDDASLEKALADAQAAYDETLRRARQRRQSAVMQAKEAGWSKYRIANAMGVRGPTVDSIIATATKAEQG